ncbi:unnamed protein product [Bathycoccus prasinos]
MSRDGHQSDIGTAGNGVEDSIVVAELLGRKFSAVKLLKQISSETWWMQENSVSGIMLPINDAQKGNLEMVMTLQMSAILMSWRMTTCAHRSASHCLKYLREASALGGSGTADLNTKMVIFTYSNILLSVSMINITNLRVQVLPSSAT